MAFHLRFLVIVGCEELRELGGGSCLSGASERACAHYERVVLLAAMAHGKVGFVVDSQGLADLVSLGFEVAILSL